jgi:Kef-type K+ transport system membrane component KefB
MSESLVATVLLDLAIIVVVARLAAIVAGRLGQPAVIGELAAGIALGPSLLGALPGDPSTLLFPHDARPFLALVGQLGLVLFMFQIGLELDRRLLKGAKVVTTIAAGSVAVPFVAGTLLLAPVLWSAYRPPGADRVAFALFVGTVLAITAFPVLARILRERRLDGTRLGALALGAAAVNDLAGWLVLAAVLGAVSAGQGVGVGVTLVGTAAFAVLLVTVVRPRLLLPLGRREPSGGTLAATLALVLAAAATSGALGTHTIFGAFLIGIAWPAQGRERFAKALAVRLEPVVRLVLMPVFFVLPGFATDIGGIGAGGAAMLCVILLAAIGSKAAGATAGARVAGLGWRDSAAIGTLMNARGLMELVVLNLGLAAGVLQPELYTLLVLMTVITTVMTDPLVRRLLPAVALEEVGRRDRGHAEGDAHEHQWHADDARDRQLYEQDQQQADREAGERDHGAPHRSSLTIGSSGSLSRPRSASR